MEEHKPKNIVDVVKKELPVASGAAGAGRDPTESMIYGVEIYRERKEYDPKEFGNMYDSQDKEKKKQGINQK